MKRFFLYAIVVVFVGCQPTEPWKTPIDIKFDLTINPQGSNGGPGDLTFHSGAVILSSIQVNGSVENADDFSFSRSFPNGLKVNFLDSIKPPELTFSLPQGNYTSLTISFETLEQTLNENILVEGRFVYNNPNKNPAIVIIEVENPKTIDLVVRDEFGNSSFEISTDKYKDPSIVLNPPFWFKNITSSIMNGSNTTIVNNQEIINITNVDNVNIYNEIDPRIGQDATSVLEGK